MRRWSSQGSGSLSKCQLMRLDALTFSRTAAGMRICQRRSLPPASSSRTRVSGDSDSRDATMLPAEPAPATM